MCSEDTDKDQDSTKKNTDELSEEELILLGLLWGWSCKMSIIIGPENIMSSVLNESLKHGIDTISFSTLYVYGRKLQERLNKAKIDAVVKNVPFQDKCCRGNRRINIQNIQEWRMAPAFGRCHFSFAVLDRSTILILCIL